jgi:hypothetical protein
MEDRRQEYGQGAGQQIAAGNGRQQPGKKRERPQLDGIMGGRSGW